MQAQVNMISLHLAMFATLNNDVHRAAEGRGVSQVPLFCKSLESTCN